MSLSTAAIVKLASGVLASTLAVGGGIAVVAHQGNDRAASSHRGGAAVGSQGVEAGADDTEVVIDPVTGVRRVVRSAAGKAKDASRSSGSATVSDKGASANAQTGSGASGTSAEVSAQPGIPSGGSGSGGSDGSGWGGSGWGNWGSPAPAVPLGVPVVAAPSGPGTPAFDHGTYQVVVPALTGVSKKLCLTGTVANKCETVTVPATRSMTLTVSYSANAGSQPPTFTPAECPGGLSVTIAHLAPGATASVSAQGVQVSATVATNDITQTASLCDA